MSDRKRRNGRADPAKASPRWALRTPRGLFARSLLIVLTPVITLQLAVTAVFFLYHWRSVTDRLAIGAAGDVAGVLALYRTKPDDFDALQSWAKSTLGLSVVLWPQATLPKADRRNFFSEVDRAVRQAADAKLDASHWIDTRRYADYVDIRVQVEAGVLRFAVRRDRVLVTTGHVFLAWVLAATALLATISIAFMRNQVRPIRRLAEAADRFGRGLEADAYKPSGAREVRQAGAAFLDMRDRLKRYVEQRTALLASVSHDLRTPLTRLKLSLSLMPPSEEVTAARADLQDMAHMLDEYLAFARGEAGETVQEADLAALVEAVAAPFARPGANITLKLDAPLPVRVRPLAIKRCLTNIIDNALAYGEQVEIRARQVGPRVEILVDDDGPGLAPEQYEHAFTPFARLDPARSQNRKGVGLGLAIARDAARGHGGEVSLAQSPLGGLQVRVDLPA
ncbi:MAG: ATP-binding protein [Maricaulaceae bacterium]